jgi:hypothetical protein
MGWIFPLMTCHSDKLDRLRSQAKGFVVRHLRKYGNSLVPDEVIDSLGVPTTARLLTVILGEPVTVYRAHAGFWIATR